MTTTGDREVLRDRRSRAERQSGAESFAMQVEGAIAYVREEVACDVVTLLREYARTRDIYTRGRFDQAFEYFQQLIKVMP